MSPTIRVDDEVFKALQRKAQAFVDSPNDVLRRLLGLSVKRNPTPRRTRGATFVQKYSIQGFRVNGQYLSKTTGEAIAEKLGVDTGAASAWTVLRQPENRSKVKEANIIAILPDSEVPLADLLSQA